MQTLIISIIYRFARQLFDKAFFERVEVLVKSLLDDDRPGAEKRDTVVAAIKREWREAKTAAIETVIQIVLLKIGQVV